MIRFFIYSIIFSLISQILLPDFKILKERRVEEYIQKTNSVKIKKTEYVVWIGKNLIVEIEDNSKTIVYLKKKKEQFIFINKKRRTILTLSFPVYFSHLFPKHLLPVKFNDYPKVRVKKLNLTETIGDYKCQLYRITLGFLMMTVKIKVWASIDPIKEFSLAFTEKNYLKNINSNRLLNTYYPNLEKDVKLNKRSFYNSLKKIKGIWVKSETNINLLVRRYKIIDKITTITNQFMPTEILKIPKDYKKITDFQN